MLCKSTLLSRLLTLISTFIIVAPAVASDTLKPNGINDPKGRIKIVYPKPDQVVSAVDSTFILGNVPAESDDLAYRLFINNQFVPVHKDGGFIAFLPVTPGLFEFRLNAFLVDKDRQKGKDALDEPGQTHEPDHHGQGGAGSGEQQDAEDQRDDPPKE